MIQMPFQMALYYILFLLILDVNNTIFISPISIIYIQNKTDIALFLDNIGLYLLFIIDFFLLNFIEFYEALDYIGVICYST